MMATRGLIVAEHCPPEPAHSNQKTDVEARCKENVITDMDLRSLVGALTI